MPLRWSSTISRRRMIVGVITLAVASFLAGAETIDVIEGDRGPFGPILMGLFALLLLMGLIVEIRRRYPQKPD
jgi:hypothetical protein